jgi:hypothetical protein
MYVAYGISIGKHYYTAKASIDNYLIYFGGHTNGLCNMTRVLARSF